MPFYFLCCLGKFLTMSVMLTYLMLQIGHTKINFWHVSFAVIFNGLKIGKVFYFNTYLTQININSTLIFLMHNYFRIKSQVLDLKTLLIFNPFKIRVTYMADCQVISYQLYQNNYLLKGSALSLRT